MDDLGTASKLIKAYVTAMHDWAIRYATAEGFPLDVQLRASISLTQRLDRSEQMQETGIAQDFDRERQTIIRRFCTPIERVSRVSPSYPPNHHPQHEVISKTRKVLENRPHLWTDYTREDGLHIRRKYALVRVNKRWRIEQHYVLMDKKAYPEIY